MSEPQGHMQQELERIVLATILSNPALASIKDLKLEYFSDIRNQAIYEIVLRLRDREGFGVSTVAEVLQQKGLPEGVTYLEKLKDYAVTETLFPELVGILKEEYFKNLRA